MLGDALIFNSVEFWTGKNPITTMKDGDREVALQRTSKGLHIDVLEAGKAAPTSPGAFARLLEQQEAGTLVAVDAR
jgi:hypothetical protein